MNLPDANCYTLPNGECVADGPCMHTIRCPNCDEMMGSPGPGEYVCYDCMYREERKR